MDQVRQPSPVPTQPSPAPQPNYDQILSELYEQVRHLSSQNQELRQAFQVIQTTGPEPKIMLPEKFSGRHSELRNFISAVKNVFELQPNRYRSARSQTGLIGSLCTGDALSWYRMLQESNSPHLQHFDNFVAEMAAHFGDPYVQDHARRQLLSLQQGRQSASSYSAKFRRIASDAAFDDQSLCYHFERGLNPDVRRAIAVNDQDFDTLSELIKYAIRVDNRLFESTRQETRTFASGSRGPVPMEIGAMTITPHKKLSDTERADRLKKGLCLYCGKPGHLARSCPNKKTQHRIASVKVDSPATIPKNV